MSGNTDYIPMHNSSASDDDSEFQLVPTPKAKPGRKRGVVKASTSASASRICARKGKAFSGRNTNKGKRPFAILEE